MKEKKSKKESKQLVEIHIYVHNDNQWNIPYYPQNVPNPPVWSPVVYNN